MSRTYKDMPTRVRKAKLKVKEQKSCVVCEEKSDNTVVVGFTAIFYAHESKEISSFITESEKLGYSLETREERGYLGENSPRFFLYSSWNSHHSDRNHLFNFYDRNRAIYDSPRGHDGNLIWNDQGYVDPVERKRRADSVRNKNVEEAPYLEYPKCKVSPKENIFTVITVSKELKSNRGRYHWHGRSDYGYLLYGHCHCGRCEPEEFSSRAEVRTIATKVQKAFNSGDMEAAEEISEEFPNIGPNGYRDWSNC